MVTLSPRARLLVLAGFVTTAFTIALAAAVADTLAPPPAVVASGSGSPCVPGVIPLNPYVVNCNLPARGNQVVGAAPDAGAIIACRNQPACLSYYVNYPDALVAPSYRP
ncbi:hypothetical protein BH09ACT8_BH09ACT8_14370 [soil metagenome]